MNTIPGSRAVQKRLGRGLPSSHWSLTKSLTVYNLFQKKKKQWTLEINTGSVRINRAKLIQRFSFDRLLDQEVRQHIS